MTGKRVTTPSIDRGYVYEPPPFLIHLARSRNNLAPLCGAKNTLGVITNEPVDCVVCIDLAKK